MIWSIDARDPATRTTLRTIFEFRDVAKSKCVKSTESLVFDLETCGNGDTRWNRQRAKHLVTPTAAHDTSPGKHENVSHTIFEGTSEIQQLVIARAISGMRIERI